MANTNPFDGALQHEPAEWREVGGANVPDYFGNAADEYEAAAESAGANSAAVFDRSDRALVRLGGGDRLTWLHNLVTNAVKTLDVHAGNYAFATDVKGRILFDLNILSLEDALWLDLPRAVRGEALAHLDRYLITEDVQLADVTDDWARLACAGPRASEVAGALGGANFPALPALGSRWIAPEAALLFRHDLTGGPGFELIVRRDDAVSWWNRLVELGCRPAGLAALDVLRIEAGLPWCPADTDGVLPPETGQIERGISYRKGCYLGQEVIERMRSHGALARRLVRVRMEAWADGEPKAPVELVQGEKKVGRITSLRRHPVRSEYVGLAYLKASVTLSDELAAGEPPRRVEVVG